MVFMAVFLTVVLAPFLALFAAFWLRLEGYIICEKGGDCEKGSSWALSHSILGALRLGLQALWWVLFSSQVWRLLRGLMCWATLGLRQQVERLLAAGVRRGGVVAAFKPRFVEGSLLDLGGDGFKKSTHTQINSFLQL